MNELPFNVLNYDVKQYINSGAFGDIYYAEERDKKVDVAIKMEAKKTSRNILKQECKIYSYLNDIKGIPKVKWIGSYLHYNVMVMELLGLSLEQLLNICNRFSLKTVLMLADQMIKHMSSIHSKGIIHRDIKPENYMLGIGKTKHILYLIDFGLSKLFRNSRKLSHIKLRIRNQMTGTVPYCSINVQEGVTASRRDDMESLCYLWIYFLNGKLPWQGLEIHGKVEKIRRIYEIKRDTPVDELCKGIPEEFAMYLREIRSMEFGDEPNYDKFISLFKNLFDKLSYEYDYEYDWDILWSYMNRR